MGIFSLTLLVLYFLSARLLFSLFVWLFPILSVSGSFQVSFLFPCSFSCSWLFLCSSCSGFFGPGFVRFVGVSLFR